MPTGVLNINTTKSKRHVKGKLKYLEFKTPFLLAQEGHILLNKKCPF